MKKDVSLQLQTSLATYLHHESRTLPWGDIESLLSSRTYQERDIRKERCWPHHEVLHSWFKGFIECFSWNNWTNNLQQHVTCEPLDSEEVALQYSLYEDALITNQVKRFNTFIQSSKIYTDLSFILDDEQFWLPKQVSSLPSGWILSYILHWSWRNYYCKLSAKQLNSIRSDLERQLLHWSWFFGSFLCSRTRGRVPRIGE